MGKIGSACLVYYVLAHLFNYHPGKPTWEDVTKAQQKIKLKQELTGSEGMVIRLQRQL